MGSRKAETAPMEAILISSAPDAGKTTMTRLLAERLPRAVTIEADVLSFDFVVAGRAVVSVKLPSRGVQATHSVRGSSFHSRY